MLSKFSQTECLSRPNLQKSPLTLPISFKDGGGGSLGCGPRSTSGSSLDWVDDVVL